MIFALEIFFKISYLFIIFERGMINLFYILHVMILTSYTILSPVTTTDLDIIITQKETLFYMLGHIKRLNISYFRRTSTSSPK